MLNREAATFNLNSPDREEPYKSFSQYRHVHDVAIFSSVIRCQISCGYPSRDADRLA